MLTLLLALAIQTPSDSNTQDSYVASLSLAARVELNLVDKLKILRGSIERLPEKWKTSSNGQKEISKQDLVSELESMELSSAERWSIILSNTAYLDRVSESKAFDARKLLSEMPKLQADLEKRIDELNFKLKDGVLLNLASKVLLQ